MIKKIAVIMGGMSHERDISLVSGKSVADALKKKGYVVKTIDLNNNVPDMVQQLKTFKPDVVFNALHGQFGEDGCLQGLLNLMQIPYTHSGVLASAAGMNKEQTRYLAKMIGIKIARGGLKTKDQMIKKPFPFPYVVKPNADGSSIGVVIVRNKKEQDALFKKWPKTKTLLVEEYIPGRELSAAVLGDKYLGSVELVTKSGFYDYKNKYTNGKTTHFVPAPIPAKIAKQLEKDAVQIHKALGCRGVTRSDFRYDDTNKKHPRLIFLEINTNPGMTPLSLVPDIAKSKKITYDTLVDMLVKEAKCD